MTLIKGNEFNSITRLLLKSVKQSSSFPELVETMSKSIANVHGNIALAGNEQNEGCIIHVNDPINSDNTIEWLDGKEYVVVTNGDDGAFSLKRKMVA
jgi:viroplasmin and RNaseH domain-containing protein